MSTCILPSISAKECVHGVREGGTCHYCNVKKESTHESVPLHDSVNHPIHYTSSPASCERCAQPIECITVTRHMSFNIGNAIKYLWRYAYKNGIEDLKKARWYLDDQIKELEKEHEHKAPKGI